MRTKVRIVKASKKQKRERQRTFRNREFFQVFTSVSSSGFADAHLDNCTVKKDSEKTSLGKRNFTGLRSLLPKFLRNFDSCSMASVTQIERFGHLRTIGLRIDEKIKLQRAQGGCPGTIRRRRTWQAAKSYGEPQAGTDP